MAEDQIPKVWTKAHQRHEVAKSGARGHSLDGFWQAKSETGVCVPD